jgi:hypothetical protein
MSTISLVRCQPSSRPTLARSGEALRCRSSRAPRFRVPLRPAVIALALLAGSPALADSVLLAGASFESAALRAHLESAGHSVTQSFNDSIPVNLAGFDTVWVNTINALLVADLARLEAFVEGGRGVYLNGEHSGCCAGASANGEALVNATVTGSATIVIGTGCASFSGNAIPNTMAVNGIATTPHAPTHMTLAGAGCISGAASANQVLSAAGEVVAAAWRDGDMAGGRGRIVVVMDSNWPGSGDPWTDEWVVNLQHFLSRGIDIFSDGFESEDTSGWTTAVEN